QRPLQRRGRGGPVLFFAAPFTIDSVIGGDGPAATSTRDPDGASASRRVGSCQSGAGGVARATARSAPGANPPALNVPLVSDRTDRNRRACGPVSKPGSRAAGKSSTVAFETGAP